MEKILAEVVCELFVRAEGVVKGVGNVSGMELDGLVGDLRVHVMQVVDSKVGVRLMAVFVDEGLEASGVDGGVVAVSKLGTRREEVLLDVGGLTKQSARCIAGARGEAIAMISLPGLAITRVLGMRGGGTTEEGMTEVAGFGEGARGRRWSTTWGRGSRGDGVWSGLERLGDMAGNVIVIPGGIGHDHESVVSAGCRGRRRVGSEEGFLLAARAGKDFVGVVRKRVDGGHAGKLVDDRGVAVFNILHGDVELFKRSPHGEGARLLANESESQVAELLIEGIEVGGRKRLIMSNKSGLQTMEEGGDVEVVGVTREEGAFGDARFVELYEVFEPVRGVKWCSVQSIGNGEQALVVRVWTFLLEKSGNGEDKIGRDESLVEFADAVVEAELAALVRVLTKPG
mmetsp:Transcript_21983/g.68806  ORF Transcript_21983/g.68806 Transcript_21983/m.68806 type:complete len:399 (+) Transcript_21983:156-1352(+)